MQLISSLMRRTPAVAAGDHGDSPKHLSWVMLTALGIGATIGAGIFSMPGIIAGKAGPAGILSFAITGAIVLMVAFCYERFSALVPNGCSAYSYVYHSIGEVFAWIVAFGLFLEYSFGSSAVAIGWGEYLKRALKFDLPPFWSGPTMIDHHYHFGINIIAVSVIILVTIVLILGGVKKSAKLNFALVCLKLFLLLTFLAAGFRHINPANWSPFLPPSGWDGVLQGAATAVFPYVGFDALFTFARESKSLRDTKLATYWCVGIVAFLYITVMATLTGLAPSYINGSPNPLFANNEAAAPLAVVLTSVGEGWTAQLIAFGAVLGIFNVLLVLCMGGPRIFRSMAEDGLLPHKFEETKNGNPTWGIAVNGAIVAITAGLVPFGEIADMMVLGTLVAFIFVCIGATRLKLVPPLLGVVGAVACMILAAKLNPLVLQVYSVSCPVGLIIYFAYSRHHSNLGKILPSELVAAVEAIPTSKE